MSKRLEREPIGRRDFLGLAGAAAAAVAIVSALIGTVRLISPRLFPEASSRFRVGHPDQFPAGTVRNMPERKVRIVAGPDGISAMSMVCTHLGCIVSEMDGGFSCPCHGSKFGPQGEVLKGPAPSALRWFEMSQAADGQLVVDSKRQVDPGTFYKIQES